MANRRMFSKTITSSSNFLMMPQSAQNLYFHLGMNSDDDGFCEYFGIMRMTDSKPDDLKILQAKGFVKIFDDKVLVILDWKENNYIQRDRYTASKYLQTYKNELKIIAKQSQKECIQNVSNMDTQVRLGKVRLGKDSITPLTPQKGGTDGQVINSIINKFKAINPSYEVLFGRKSQREAVRRLVDKYGYEKLGKMIDALPEIISQKYAPRVTTPCQLEEKLGEIKIFVEQHKSKSNLIII